MSLLEAGWLDCGKNHVGFVDDDGELTRRSIHHASLPFVWTNLIEDSFAGVLQVEG